MCGLLDMHKTHVYTKLLTDVWIEELVFGELCIDG